MITESDSYNTIEFDKYYAILPSYAPKEKYLKHFNGWEVPKGFKYNSGSNSRWVNEKEMVDLIKKHIDHDFSPILLTEIQL